MRKCSILIDPISGEIDKVVAPNGKESILYQSLLDLGLDKEAALDKWAVTHTATFQHWFQNGTMDSNSEAKIISINGVPLFINEKKSPKHAIQDIGVFPKEAEIWDKEKSGEKSPAVEQKLDKIQGALNTFFTSIGVNKRIVDNITDKKGNILSVVSKANLTKRIVDIAQGKIGIDSLPEEAAHFFVAIMKEKEDPLYKSLMNNIENYDIYKKVIASDFYQKIYKGNEELLKEEAIGQVIAQHVVNQVLGTDTQIKRVESWWNRLWNKIKNFFNISNDPYAESAYLILNESIDDYFNITNADLELKGIMYQEKSREEPRTSANTIIDSLNKTKNTFTSESVAIGERGVDEPWLVDISKTGQPLDVYSRYVNKITGKVVRGRVSDKVRADFYSKTQYYKHLKDPKNILDDQERAKIRMTNGTLLHESLEDLINFLKVGKTKEKNPSEYTQLKNTAGIFKNNIDLMYDNVKNLVNEINTLQNNINKENGTKGKATIIAEAMVYDDREDIGGTIDVMAVFNDGSAAIYDWKSISPSDPDIVKTVYKQGIGKKQLVADPFNVKYDSYETQLGAYKKMLLEKYGVSKVIRSRIIPLHIQYKWQKIKNKYVMLNEVDTFQMGTDTLKGGSEFLAQIPVAGEETKYESINKIIESLLARRALINKRLETKRFQAGEDYVKAKSKVTVINKQLRRLQLKADLAYVLKGIHTDFTGITEKISDNREFLKQGVPNPNYLSLSELNDLHEDLVFYESLLKTPDYLEELSLSKDPADQSLLNKVEDLRKPLSSTIINLKAAVESKLRDRVDEKARDERDIKGLTSYNPTQDFWTTQFVSLSNQSNPFLRNLWQIVDNLHFTKRKESKQMATKISELQEAMIREQGKGFKSFDLIINEKNNLISKYKSEYYKGKREARNKGDWKWIKENTVINEEAFKRQYKKWETAKIKQVNNKYPNPEHQTLKAKELLAFKKAFDIYNHFETASLSFGGKYFLLAKDNWLSEEYKTLKQNPAAKEFYDFFQDIVQQAGDNFGIDFSRNFIPNVHKSLNEIGYDKVTGQGGSIKDKLMSNFQVREHDLSIGYRDPDTGELIRRIPQFYVRPLRDKKGNIDHSLKSRDLGKSLLMLFNASLDFKLKTEILPEILAMETILKEGTVREIPTDATGGVLKKVWGQVSKIGTKEVSTNFTAFVNEYIYGQSIDHKELKYTKSGTSGTKLSTFKSLMAAKQYHSMIALGFRIPVAAGAFFAGTLNMWSQAVKGTHITKKTLLKSQTALIRSDSKMRALAEHLDIYQRDDPKLREQRLSANYMLRNASDDKWFWFISSADRGLDAMMLHAVSQNYGIDPETGSLEKLSKLPEGTLSILESTEITKNPKWKSSFGVSQSPIDKFITVIKGLDGKPVSREVEMELRNIAKRMSEKVKGNLSVEDKALFNQNVLFKFMMHYKSWLPGIALERFGRVRYDHILKNFEHGTYKVFFNNLGVDATPEEFLDGEVHMLNYITEFGKDVVKIATDIITFGYANTAKVKEKRARGEFDQWVANNLENPEFAERIKDPKEKEKMFEEFLEMKRANMRAALNEFRMIILLMMLLRSLGDDDDNDGTADIRETWGGRKFQNLMNRTYREVAIFVSPTEFLQSGRATGIPLLTLGHDIIQWGRNTVDETHDLIVGEAPYTNHDRAERWYRTNKLIPGVHGFARLFESHTPYRSIKY